jgi:crotonobetainyl-CoA:carnitine CoA-transferase CaiB-like acyl-CoA transferase
MATRSGVREADVSRPTAENGPLSGLRILDLGTIFAGPLIGAHLGDLGADVIKVEPPRGDDVRRLGSTKNGIALWWKVVARNKKLVAIDLTRPEGAEILLRLAREADVVVENFRPGKLETWGLAYEALAAVNPRLILLHISGYGRDGPYRSRPGFGTLAEAFSGFAFTNGHPDGPPTLPSFPIADGVTALVGCYTVLAALRERDASGRGQEIDLNLYESLLTLMGNMIAGYDQLGEVMQRRGNRSKASVPRNAYTTRDGRWVVISSTTDAMAARVFRAIGRDDLASDPTLATNLQRAQRIDEIDSIVATWVAERTQSQALEALHAFDVPAGPINDVKQFVEDSHVLARGSITRIDDPDFGSICLPNVVARFSRTPGRVRWAGRSPVGADTREVLRGAGYTDAEIDRLSLERIIRTADDNFRKQPSKHAVAARRVWE